MSFKVQQPNLRGSKNPASKLTEQEVAEIRISDKSSYTLAKLYKVNRRTIGRIRSGEAWAAVICAWVLWQSGEAWVGKFGTAGEEPSIIDTYNYRYECNTEMNRLQHQRNPLLLKGDSVVVVPTWACLPVGVPPEKATFR